MNRRSFFKLALGGVAAVAVAPKAVEAVCTCVGGTKPLIGTAEEWCQVHGTPMVECVPALKGYADYTNFSQFASCEEIDKVVMDTAAELGKAFGKRISTLYAEVTKYD